MSIEFNIPGYGRLRGRETRGIAEFLNIQYGTIAARFEYASLFEGSADSTFDCTKQGPLCPQKEPFNDNYNGVPLEDCAPLDVYYDEFKCLNMRLQVPSKCLDSEYPHKVPVVVWLHGGSNIAGTPYRGSSDAQRWLEKAAENGKPFAILTPHYRVGALGWLPKRGLYNQAISDQRLAVEWARKHSHAWNGDNERISIIGQSAGASDAFVHLCDPDSYNLVHQIGMLSGHVGSGGFAPRIRYIHLLEKFEELLKCSVDDASTEELMDVQLKLGIQVYAAVNPTMSDDDLEGLGELDWSGFDKVRAIVSDCAEDGEFIAEDARALEAAEALGVSKSDAPEFYTDLVFRSGAEEIWKAGGSSVMRQICDAVNPYTPTMGNNHMVELHYIINGYKTRPEYEDAIEKCQQVWTDLVYFESPWNSEHEAFYMPPTGIPHNVSIDEAHDLRPSKSLNVIRKYDVLSYTMRGW